MDRSQPARVWTSASARTVPADCGSDLTAQDGVAVAADAVGIVVVLHVGDVESADQDVMRLNGALVLRILTWQSSP